MKPNILLIMADQLAARFLPAYGNPVVKAPNLDRLAAEGVVFENSYANSPLCAPARAACMIGPAAVADRRLRQCRRVRRRHPDLRPLPARSRATAPASAGKMHFIGPDQLHGFEERLTTDIYPADFGWTPDWRLRRGERIDWWYHNMASVTQAGTAEITNQLEYDDEVAFLANRKLYDCAALRRDEPFCLTVSFTHPHDPYVARRRYWDLYRDGDIDLPTVGPIPYDELDPAQPAPATTCRPCGDYAVTEDECAPRGAAISPASPMSTT